MKARRCWWVETMGPDEDYWETGCHEAFTFLTDGPAENNVKFCCFCGRPIKVVRRAKD